jgi:hypothetical protein
MCLHQQDANYLLGHWIKGLTLAEIIWVADQVINNSESTRASKA